MLILTAASLVVHLDGGAAATVPSVSTDGRLVFVARGCSGCHTTVGVEGGSFGPDLTEIADRAATRVPGLDAEGYIRQSIREPDALRVPGYYAAMPTIPLTEAELSAVVAYLLEP
jgi:cytochrome c oxidase subunit 2